MRFKHMYLTNKYRAIPKEIEDVCALWSMPEDEFTQKIDAWFDNFKAEDYDLAYKILKEVDYYSKENYNRELSRIWNDIERRVIGLKKENVLLIVPDGHGDSAHKHVYELIKSWGVFRKQIFSINQLESKAISDDNVLIAFNDTYGSGKQFVSQMLENALIKSTLEKCQLFVVGITISDQARNYIKHSLTNACVLPESSPKTIYNTFNYLDTIRIERLGADIYPPHPTGYGRAGLLVAYDFQCPNNSIPIIWANSKMENNEFERYAYPWNPLFEYRPKIKTDEKKDINKERRVHNEFTPKTKLNFSKTEIEEINSILINWKCSRITHNNIVSKLNKWFDNFEESNKELAINIFKNINYMSLAKTREEIRNLRKKIFDKISKCSDDKSNIILVITGDEIESKYHYVYDFMRIWGLQISQILTFEHLCKHPYEAVGKHLIFFYHTRIHKQETFISEIWPQAKKLPAKFFHILSFLMSEITIEIFDNLTAETTDKNIKYYYCENISRPLKQILLENELMELENLLKSKTIKSNKIGDKFLTSYYFNCPKDTLSLLWYDRKVNALFISK